MKNMVVNRELNWTIAMNFLPTKSNSSAEKRPLNPLIIVSAASKYMLSWIFVNNYTK
jgi:hypothetical protein